MKHNTDNEDTDASVEKVEWRGLYITPAEMQDIKRIEKMAEQLDYFFLDGMMIPASAMLDYLERSFQGEDMQLLVAEARTKYGAEEK